MTLGEAEFQTVARTLGLRMEGPAFSTGRMFLDGIVDGVPIRIEHWRGQFVHVDFTASLDPPADMRFSIRPSNLASSLRALLGIHDIDVGDPTFDKAFDVKADEPPRAKALLTPELQRTLLAWEKATSYFVVNDEAVHLMVMAGNYQTLAPEVIVADARAMASLARTVSAALAHVPPSTILATHADAWAAHAETQGLSISRSPLRVTGKLNGNPIVARAVATDGHAYGVDVVMALEPRLPWFLRVRPARLLDVFELARDQKHVETGDAAFDRVFRVTTTDEDKTKEFLDASVRGALLALDAERGAVLFESSSLSVRTNEMTDPSTFGHIVDRLATVAEKLHERAAPYR